MKYTLGLLVLLLACSSNTNNLTLDELPVNWISLTKTDSGFVHKTHSDLGSEFLQIINAKQVKLIADQSMIEFNIDNYTLSGSHSFACDGEFRFGARLKGEKPQIGKLKFEWINQEKEVGLWTISFNGEEIEVYFTTQERIKEYPLVTIGYE